MGKSIVSMAIFNSNLLVYQRVSIVRIPVYRRTLLYHGCIIIVVYTPIIINNEIGDGIQ